MMEVLLEKPRDEHSAREASPDPSPRTLSPPPAMPDAGLRALAAAPAMSSLRLRDERREGYTQQSRGEKRNSKSNGLTLQPKDGSTSTSTSTSTLQPRDGNTLHPRDDTRDGNTLQPRDDKRDGYTESNGHTHSPLPASPLRAAFTPDTADDMDTQRPSTAHSTPAPSNSHAGPPTAADFNLPSLSSDPSSARNGSPKGSRAALSPSAFTLRHDSDSATRSTLAQRRANASGAATPLDNRSVQFASGEEHNMSLAEIQGQIAHEMKGSDSEDALESNRKESFFGKLKASFTPTHSRQPSEFTNGFSTPVMTPRDELEEPRYPVSNVDGSEAEGDVEDSEQDDATATQDASKSKKQRRKGKRKLDKGPSSAPSTPKTPRLASFLRGDRADNYFSSMNGNGANGLEAGPVFLPRRSTMGEIPEHARAGVSEDEGRDRLAKSAWRRGLDNARGLSYHHRRPSERDPDTPDVRRPGLAGRRRITGLEGGASPWRSRTDRQMSTSAQKWRQVKAGLQMLGRREKSKRQTVDHQKSAELMAELLAGSPAAIFFASMYQRDEHGRRRIPVLLEQLKINIPTSQTRESKGERHNVFTINLEYGNGPSRMSWTIHRSLRDFANLHLKYKFQSQNERYNPLKGDDRSGLKMPRFPRSTFPYLRGVRGLQDDDEEDDNDNAVADQSGPDGEASGHERPGLKKKRRVSLALSRRKSSASQAVPDTVGIVARTGSMAGALPLAANNPKAKELYTERQRKKLEIYLQQMIKWLIFRPDANRLCKFLELSSLAMRLAVEGGYHGKEGHLSIVSKPKIDLRRRPTAPSMGAFKLKHAPKWFLVRHSYLVAVDSPESLEVRECFLVDADFSLERSKKAIRDQSGKEMAKSAAATAQPKHHLLKLYNSERKIKCLAKNERQLLQFKESIEMMQKKTIWSQQHRFDSFAPVRKNVFARWLVDGRDHMWQVSRAIDRAKSFIYIHDWWLSPELYMRRPAAISQKWRLDRLLLRKAQEGVKVFVIVYRNIESAIPIDSEYTKASLLDLHPNVCVQRSPNQFRQNQFFWAHHEKLVVVDNQMAFVGGIDLCFGRWDDPNHSLIDDKLTGFEMDMDVARNADNCQVWPGKDYSNPRVQDFYGLDRPYEEMYDRTKVPRMPWHDISMCIVGQPARDVGRHFIQRWNYILRQRVPSRPTPILLPPPEYDQDELEQLGMTGTCTIQILRSCTTWSIGTPNKTECSIMNAYVALIKGSEHFVYIENQFFISSCVVEGTTIQNKIGDALVERAERAYLNGEKWRACLIVPLMPGFQNSVDSQDGTSVRLIMQCQYRSICRGETSIFGRLRAKGINPQDYIEFYALRQWGKIGPQKCLTTEQLYIHAKCMIVDDRAAIIGSANINERSMLGSRDSEVAAVVTDNEITTSYMGGKPYEVGTFPHTLRMRLMREHLGIDVDELHARQREADEEDEFDDELDHIYNRESFETPPTSPRGHDLTEKNLAKRQQHAAPANGGKADILQDWVSHSQSAADNNAVDDHDGSQEKKKHLSAGREHDLDVAGFGPDNWKNLETSGDLDGRDTYINARGHEVMKSVALVDHTIPRQSHQKHDHHAHHGHHHHAPDNSRLLPPSMPPRMNTRELGLTQLSQLPALPQADDTDIGGPPLNFSWSSGNAHIINPLLQSMSRPVVEDDSMKDPLVDSFYENIWHKVAENNTRLYRQVFRCMPDSEVQSWREYREFSTYSEKFMQSQGLGTGNKTKKNDDAPSSSGPPGSGGTDAVSNVVSEKSKGRLSGISNFLHRRRSNTDSTTESGTVDLNEKQRQEQSSRASDSLTVTGNSPEDDPTLDEKTAAGQRDAAETSTTGNRSSTLDGYLEPPPAPPTNGSLARPRTVQYADNDEPANTRLNAAFAHANAQINGGNPAPINTTTTNTSDLANEKSGLQHSTSQSKRRRRATTKSSGAKPFFSGDDVLSKDEAEGLLKLVQGHLVQWPYDWLEREEKGGNWLYNIDQLAPLEIYD